MKKMDALSKSFSRERTVVEAGGWLNGEIVKALDQIGIKKEADYFERMYTITANDDVDIPLGMIGNNVLYLRRKDRGIRYRDVCIIAGRGERDAYTPFLGNMINTRMCLKEAFVAYGLDEYQKESLEHIAEKRDYEVFSTNDCKSFIGCPRKAKVLLVALKNAAKEWNKTVQTKKKQEAGCEAAYLMKAYGAYAKEYRKAKLWAFLADESELGLAEVVYGSRSSVYENVHIAAVIPPLGISSDRKELQLDILSMSSVKIIPATTDEKTAEFTSAICGNVHQTVYVDSGKVRAKVVKLLSISDMMQMPPEKIVVCIKGMQPLLLDALGTPKSDANRRSEFGIKLLRRAKDESAFRCEGDVPNPANRGMFYMGSHGKGKSYDIQDVMKEKAGDSLALFYGINDTTDEKKRSGISGGITTLHREDNGTCEDPMIEKIEEIIQRRESFIVIDRDASMYERMRGMHLRKDYDVKVIGNDHPLAPYTEENDERYIRYWADTMRKNGYMETSLRTLGTVDENAGWDIMGDMRKDEQHTWAYATGLLYERDQKNDKDIRFETELRGSLAKAMNILTRDVRNGNESIAQKEELDNIECLDEDARERIRNNKGTFADVLTIISEGCCPATMIRKDEGNKAALRAELAARMDKYSDKKVRSLLGRRGVNIGQYASGTKPEAIFFVTDGDHALENIADMLVDAVHEENRIQSNGQKKWIVYPQNAGMSHVHRLIETHAEDDRNDNFKYVIGITGEERQDDPGILDRIQEICGGAVIV